VGSLDVAVVVILKERVRTAAMTAIVLTNHGWQGTPKRCSPECAAAAGLG